MRQILATLVVFLWATGCGDIVVGTDAGADAKSDAQVLTCTYGDDGGCDDGDSCTEDVCLVDGTCTHTPKTGVCLVGDVCFAPGESPTDQPCRVCDPDQSLTSLSTLACDDGDPCTVDLCDATAGCTHVAGSDGSACLRSDCPLPGLCSAGVCEAPCAPGNCGGVDCNSLAASCASANCVDDRCVVEPRTEGVTCVAPSTCTVNAACDTEGNCAGDYDTSTCGCSAAADCDDGLPCTLDECDPVAGCTHTLQGAFCLLLGSCFPAGAPHPSDRCRVCNANQPEGWTPLSCDDGDSCSFDSCSPTQGCSNLAGAGCCVVDADCDGIPIDPCQRATCNDGACMVDTDPAADGGTCDDGNACTQGDTCQSGSCSGELKVCSSGDACNPNTCDPESGECGVTLAPSGTTCDDGLSCTGNDACDGAGSCVGIASCAVLDGPCTTGSCGPDGSCVATIHDGQICDDGDPCTTGDQCDAGGFCLGNYEATVSGCSCVGDPTICDDGLACTTDSCLPSGQCQNAPEDGTCVIASQAGTKACYSEGTTNPQNLCAVCDTSQSVTGWSIVSCDDNNECTSDYCEVESGCLNIPLSAGSACDDNNACTSDEVCDSQGQCTGTCGCQTASDCEGDAGACQQWACVDFECVAAANTSVDGESCDDGQACTAGETCSAGVCTGGAAIDCTASGDGVCMVGVCDDGAGGCIAEPASNGTSCDDGEACTVNDICSGGTCSGNTKDCSSLETVCATAACNPSNGQCVATITVGEDCDDGDDTCTLGDTCNAAGLCVGTWNDDACGCNEDSDCGFLTDVCNTGRCNTGNNSCYAEAKTGNNCDDGNACTANDECKSNGSCGGSTYSCNSDLSCQSAVCDGNGGCSETTNSGFCVIGGSCYSNGEANPSNPCQACITSSSNSGWSNVANGTSCNADGNGCTQNDSCQSGVCNAGAPANCLTDGLSCTDQVCTSTGPNGFQCDTVPSGSGCFIGGSCYSNGATHPSNPCQRCTQSSPTTWSNKSNGTSCNADSNGCTVGDSCQSGSCSAGSPPDCNDGNSCTSDSCASTGASSYSCSNTVNSGKCLIGGTCYNVGTTNPSNGCQQCSSGNSGSWTNKSSGTSCGSSANTDCTNPDTCNGSGTCNPNHASSLTTCGAAPGECTNWDTCNGSGTCVDNGHKLSGTPCGSSSDTSCTDPDTCNGSGTCNANHEPAGTSCGGVCNECTSNGLCDFGYQVECAVVFPKCDCCAQTYCNECPANWAACTPL